MRTAGQVSRNPLQPRLSAAPAASPQPAMCPNCASEEEPDLRAAVENLGRKYTQLAELMARYMSQANLERGIRAANANEMADVLKRIVGGVETLPGAFPECCLIGRRFPNGSTTWFCTGVLVHPRVVLTAAHCQDPQFAMNQVALNATNQNALGNAEIIRVRRVVVNPSYPASLGHDISVLILRRDATVTPVPIASTAEIAAATRTTLVGFGNSDVLSTRGFGVQREVDVDITNLRRAQGDNLDDAEQEFEFESDLEFTAGGNGFDSCNGDSGGPAYITVGAGRRVAGLTSRGFRTSINPCGGGGVYTRVDTQREFILDAMRAAGISDSL